MNKLFRFFLTSAAIAAALVGVVSCQKDFSGDIEDLNKKVTELTNKLNELQTNISNGEIVTAVTSTANGITVQTNKGSYTIANGKDGKDGKDGTNGTNGKDGSVVTIGENGNWFIDGVDKGIAAAGKNGTNGTDGKNGEYYVPNPETGLFDKYTWNAEKKEYVKEATTISYVAPGAITAVWDAENNQLIFKGIEGKDPYTITLVAELKSLVFVPQAYVEGVEAMLIETFTYNALTLKDKDSAKEIAEAAKEESTISPTVVAQYYVNPANADLTDLTFDFVTEANLDYIATRTDASKDFKVEVAGWEEGKHQDRRVVNVTLKVTGSAAIPDEESMKISVVALEAKTPDGQLVLSDYATLYSNAIDQIRIADPTVEAKKKGIADGEEHYRRAIKGINAVDDEAYIADKAAWEDATTLPESKAICDTVVLYSESIDLAGVVAAHGVGETKCTELTAERLAALGLEWNIELVKNYKIGEPVTDQADFVKLDGTVFTPKVFDLESSEAAIGRTPIFRVNLVNPAIKDKAGKPEIVECAYVKVFIGAPEDVIEDATFPLNLGPVSFACADTTLTITVKQMNEEVYTPMHTSHDNFRAMYTADAANAKGVGTVVENTDMEQTQATVVWTWTISADELWDNMGKEISIKIPYTHNVNGRVITLELKTKVADDFQTVFDVTPAQYIKNYWYDVTSDYKVSANATYKYNTRYNVLVPTSVTDDNDENCQFINDINASFVTWGADEEGTPGVLKLNKNVTQIEYFFCLNHKINAPKIEGKDVEFKLFEADGETEIKEANKSKATVLKGRLKGAEEYELIATIYNDGSQNDLPNAIVLNKGEKDDEGFYEDNLAKKLLNTEQLYVLIGAKGLVCAEEEEEAQVKAAEEGAKGKEVQITFNGKDCFEADYVRPVNLGTNSAKPFIDAVDFGETGSYLRIEDLINPYDWRLEPGTTHNRYFSDHENYWGYYGLFDVEVDLENVTCDLTENKKVPETVILSVMSAEDLQAAVPEDVKLPETKYGYLTYVNNGTGVEEFHLFLNVTVKYGWGTITSEKPITVKVESTIEKK